MQLILNVARYETRQPSSCRTSVALTPRHSRGSSVVALVPRHSRGSSVTEVLRGVAATLRHFLLSRCRYMPRPAPDP